MEYIFSKLNISSVLNSHLPGPRWRAQSHIVLDYSNENMRFIRLFLANRIAYTFFTQMIRNIKEEIYGTFSTN